MKGREHQAGELPLKRADYYNVVRSQVEAENQLSGTRVLWILIAQSLLADAYGTLLNAHPQAKNAIYAAQQEALFWGLPVAALFAAVLGLAAVVASHLRIRELERFYKRYEEKTGPSDRSTEGYPPLQPGRIVDVLTKMTKLGLPVLFILLWAAVLAVQLVRT